MGSLIKNWDEMQEELVKKISETGGYLFVPEAIEESLADLLSDENEIPAKKQERGIVLKIEKGGKISDAVLSFGFKKTRLDKENIVGLSINDFERSVNSSSRKVNKSVNTLTEPDEDTYDPVETYRYNKETEKDELAITFRKREKSRFFFSFRDIRESSQREFDKYKKAEEVRNLRYNRALKNPSDPLLDKLPYQDAIESQKPSSEEEMRRIASGILHHNYGNGKDVPSHVVKLCNQTQRKVLEQLKKEKTRE